MVLFQTKYVQIIPNYITSARILTDRARLTATSKLLIVLGGEIVFAAVKDCFFCLASLIFTLKGTFEATFESIKQ